MSRSSAQLPGLVPILSRGKHRNARKGACFMEFAAYLAGERWSDHPKCTHPLLAALARLVNDHTSDAQRSKLVELVPSVIGLTTQDVLVDVQIARRCAYTALPIVSAEKQNVMAVGLMTADRVLAELDSAAWRSGEEESRYAFEQAPQAARWAHRFGGSSVPSAEEFRRRAAPNIVCSAVPAIAQACIPNPDEILHDLLRSAIRDCEVACGRDGNRTPRPEEVPAGEGLPVS